MGLRPEASLLSLALPSDAEREWARRFVDGYRALSAEMGIALVGGDTTASKGGLAISVVAIGRGAAACVKRRSAARVGDVIFVGGELGASACGLRDILAGRADSPNAHVHRNPAAQVAEGEWLGRRDEVHAMMDLSDGLASDLCHILRASECGAEVDVECVPAVDGDVETAVCGGEDYKLLFTVDSASAEQLQHDFQTHFGRRIYPIGRITSSSDHSIVWLSDEEVISPSWRGYTHF